MLEHLLKVQIAHGNYFLQNHPIRYLLETQKIARQNLPDSSTNVDKRCEGVKEKWRSLFLILLIAFHIYLYYHIGGRKSGEVITPTLFAYSISTLSEEGLISLLHFLTFL